MEIGHYFNAVTYQKGVDDFKAQKVTILELNDHLIRARVEGAAIEIVRIEVKNDGIDSLYCSCASAKRGVNCQHMAAVFEQSIQEENRFGFEIEAFNADLEIVVDEHVMPEPISPEVIQELGYLLTMLSHEDLIAYLVFLFEIKPHLAEGFLSFDFNHTADDDDSQS